MQSKKTSRKKQVCHKCDSLLDVVFEGEGVQYPVFTCPECGPQKNVWADWWSRYSKLHLNPTAWNGGGDKRDLLSCFVGRFCAMYQRFYNSPFTFSYTSPVPFKEKTFVMARRILAMFDGDAVAARKYLEWVFLHKIRTPKYTVRTLGFFASADFANEYRGYLAHLALLRRSTLLPPAFLAWCWENEPEIFDKTEFTVWNNLNGLVAHVKARGTDGPEKRVVEEAVKRGMLPPGPEYRKLAE